METYCPQAVLFLGGFLTLIAFASLLRIYPLLIRDDENRRISFVLTLVGAALMAVSRL